jgi:recombinational DNA repair ATPase RecF
LQRSRAKQNFDSLDDVLDELDAERRKAMAALLAGGEA